MLSPGAAPYKVHFEHPPVDRITPIAEVSRDGFETAIVLPRGATGSLFAAVAALDGTGTVLAQSAPVSIAA